jgi:hypothetical protein
MVRRCARGAIARGAAKRAVVREHARAMLGAGVRNLEAIGEVEGFNVYVWKDVWSARAIGLLFPSDDVNLSRGKSGEL